MTSGPLSSSQSFTGASGVRHPAPDVARGAMLILIAVANVPAWIAYFPEAAERTVLDQWWVVVRSALVDHRAYPLFALLFGYGLMTMVLRRSAAHERSRIAQLDARAPGLPPEQRAAWEEAIRKEARLDARRLVTRRGWWMLLFGACHALLFPGDIIGTYALVALVFGALLAGRHFRWMTAIGIVATVVLTYLMVSFAHYGGQLGVDFSGAVGGTERLTWSWPLSNVGLWLSIQPLSILGTLIVPAAFIGAWLATTDIVSDPQRHRSLLWATAGVGLTLTALGGLPEGLVAAGMGESGTLWKIPLHELSGLPGALGWLALFLVLAGPAVPQLSGWRRFFSAVGMKSMTAYLLQSVLFALILGVMGLAGVRSVGDFPAMAIAVVVWAVIALVCVWLESTGRTRGPFEILLRKAVARSARAVAWPVVPEAPVMPVTEAGPDHPEAGPDHPVGTR